VCTSESELAARQLAANQFPTFVQVSEDLAEEVLQFEPDLVINDFLDTGRDYVLRLKEKNVRVVNIEDMGEGAEEADLVINALYEQAIPQANHRVGPDYFCLRDEFLQVAPAIPKRRDSAVRQVLITFGGTDDADLTRRIFELIYPEALRLGIGLSIMIGPGYVHAQSLQRRIAMLHSDLVEIVNGTKRISEYMARADLAFSSAGRTVFELVTMRVPSIIFAANEREELHTFASPQNGLVYLGRHDEVTDREILQTFHDLINHPEKRQEMYERMTQHDFRGGKKRVIDEILSLLYTPIAEEKFLCPA
jgi:spore coat polysaccharide biosynthesis predicted glycosyltransferase SpsG